KPTLSVSIRNPSFGISAARDSVRRWRTARSSAVAWRDNSRSDIGPMQSSRLQRYLKRPRIDAPLGGALALLAACLAAGDVAAQPNPDSANEAAPSLQALRIARDRLVEARD